MVDWAQVTAKLSRANADQYKTQQVEKDHFCASFLFSKILEETAIYTLTTERRPGSLSPTSEKREMKVKTAIYSRQIDGMDRAYHNAIEGIACYCKRPVEFIVNQCFGCDFDVLVVFFSNVSLICRVNICFGEFLSFQSKPFKKVKRPFWSIPKNSPETTKR